MNISVTERNERVPVTIFHVQGDIDANTYEAFEQRAREAIAQGTRHLLVDLRQVEYISSAGIRALNTVFQLLRSNSGESEEALYQGLRSGTYKSRQLKLLGPKPRVATALSTTGVDMFLEIYPDLDKALASF